MSTLKIAKVKGTILNEFKLIEKTNADAILYRLVHHSLRVKLYGESIRKRKTKNENSFR